MHALIGGIDELMHGPNRIADDGASFFHRLSHPQARKTELSTEKSNLQALRHCSFRSVHTAHLQT